MSRIPAPSSTSSRARSPIKPSPSSPTKSTLGSSSASSIRTRTQSTVSPARPSALRPPGEASTPLRTRTKSTVTKSATPKTKIEPMPAAPPLSIKEAIALKRAEAKKAQFSSGAGAVGPADDSDAIPGAAAPKEDDALLGRWSIRETIERGRSSGSVNIAARSLICLPSALFEIHLGVTPEPLKSVPKEPPLPEDGVTSSSKRIGKNAPAWFEAQDLQTLKAWNNEILEIQPEISLFGSLKVIDLHNNKLSQLPDSLGDLCFLTVLDISHNSITSLPVNLWSLPQLTTLNISHNKLSSLPINSPFAGGRQRRQLASSTSSFFVPVIERADSPLPRLVSLDASYNQIPAGSVDLVMPASVNKIDLSGNPLQAGSSAATAVQSLLKHLATSLPNLKELRFEHADISDDAIPPNLFSDSSFSSLRTLDFGETKLTKAAVDAATKHLNRHITFDVTTEDPPEGTLRIIVGKQIVREAWEIELEKNAKARAVAKQQPVVKEDWEIDAEEGATEGARRRQRAAAAATTSKAAASPASTAAKPATEMKKKDEVMKEAWEVEAEQGLLTEGGRRRARALAAEKAKPSGAAELGIGFPSRGSSPSNNNNTASSLSLSNPQYYTQTTNTLTLPPSAPTKVTSHSRAISVAASSFSAFSSSSMTDIVVPTPTMPLAEISAQPFATTLKVLILKNRRLDKSISLPGGESALLPCLEELSLEGCNLPDSVPVSRSTSSPTERTPEPLLPLISRLFPNLLSLDLSYNTLTNTSTTHTILSSLILSSTSPFTKKGLKHLRLRGNKLGPELDGFRELSERMFKGNREVPEEWKLEELDLRDNEIGKLPPELGMLPLEVFLVDGNAFRVPARRVWEREGTKGLLSWLRGRME